MLVEGQDPLGFFDAFLRHENLRDAIQILDFGGITELRAYLKALVAVAGFPQTVASMGIVRDAEQGATPAASALQSVRDALTAAGLPSPNAHATPATGTITVRTFILPDGQSPGMIETLCMQAVANDPAMRCVNDYLVCLSTVGALPSKLDKARAQAFLASRPRAGLRLKDAAIAGYWSLASSIYDPLRSFIHSL